MVFVSIRTLIYPTGAGSTGKRYCTDHCIDSRLLASVRVGSALPIVDSTGIIQWLVSRLSRRLFIPTTGGSFVGVDAR